MKKFIALICLSCGIVAAKAQEKTVISDSGAFYLHKFAQHIGKETY